VISTAHIVPFPLLSFLRRRESRSVGVSACDWIPACAGMTEEGWPERPSEFICGLRRFSQIQIPEQSAFTQIMQ